MYDITPRGGTVVDGTGGQPWHDGGGTGVRAIRLLRGGDARAA